MSQVSLTHRGRLHLGHRFVRVRVLLSWGPVSVLLGVAAVLFLIVGLYVLYSEYRFVRDGNRLLALRTTQQTPGPASDFEDVAESVRQSPDDWQNWLALAEAYREHGDSSAGRRAMQRAILLQRGVR